jgi:hypothetical protein
MERLEAVQCIHCIHIHRVLGQSTKKVGRMLAPLPTLTDNQRSADGSN